MAEFTLTLRTEKAISENTNTLRELYNDGCITVSDLVEILEEAEREEEYEVAVSVRDVLSEIKKTE